MDCFFRWGGGCWGARISEIFLYKESGKCFYKESKFNKKKKKKKILAVGRGGVARVMFFFLFSKESKSEKKNSFIFEGVKVREDWLV